MNKFLILTEAISYIEENLYEPISRKDIALHCHVSLSMLEKLFRYALRFSIKDYIIRRRMTQAAKDILKSNMNITETGMKYQFNSPEVFSRAFKRVWGVNPSQFSYKWKFTAIFPKINYNFKEGDDMKMARKRVDISEFYDFLKSMKNSYVLCFDVEQLAAINDISGKAGDMAILEAASRIDSFAEDNMAVLRIGGDEFALITGLYEYGSVEELSRNILSLNGEPIIFNNKELPVSLWCGITKVPDTVKYDSFLTDMHNTIDESKK